MAILQNKRAFVTSGAHGIGAAIARHFADADGDVIIADIDGGPLAGSAVSAGD